MHEFSIIFKLQDEILIIANSVKRVENPRPLLFSCMNL